MMINLIKTIVQPTQQNIYSVIISIFHFFPYDIIIDCNRSNFFCISFIYSD